MAKLTYWCAERVDDNRCYSLVDKTKRGLQKQMESGYEHATFLPVVKCSIVYKDAFDLMDQLTGEDGGRGYSNN
jgi:hypothetical protein